MSYEYFSRDLEILPAAHATIPLSNIEFSYGFGVYETIRVDHGKPRFLDDHLERLMESAAIIGLTHEFTKEAIEKVLLELIDKNGVDTCNIKMLLIGGKKPMLNIICLNPLFPDKDLYRDGVLCTTYQYERSFPHAKTLNMLDSYIAYRGAKEKGGYDALFLDREGNLLEGTRTNLLAIRGRTIHTPPEDKILFGVTRKHVLEVAGLAGFDVKTENIPLAHVDDYEDLFLTSTSSKIMPIAQIDETRLKAPSPSLKELMAAFDAFLDQGNA